MAKKSSKLLLDVADVWPQERDYMERPERFKYVRKIIKPKLCVFCAASKVARPSAKSLLLYKGKSSMVVLNKFPYNSGHLLVMPTRHVGNIIDLKSAEYNELMGLLRSSIEIIQKAYGIEDLNVGMNHGAVAGAGIPDHLHWHIVPRWLGDTNFFPLIAETKVHPETLVQVFKRLRPFFIKKMEVQCVE